MCVGEVGGDEGFSHGMYLCVYACTRLFVSQCTSSTLVIKLFKFVATGSLVAFVLAYNVFQMASDLYTGRPLLSEIIYFS